MAASLDSTKFFTFLPMFISELRLFTHNMVLVFFMAGFSSEREFDAGAPPEQGERVRVGRLDIEGPNTVHFHIPNQKRIVKHSLSH